jgi:hypothetical protein
MREIEDRWEKQTLHPYFKLARCPPSAACEHTSSEIHPFSCAYLQIIVSRNGKEVHTLSTPNSHS